MKSKLRWTSKVPKRTGIFLVRRLHSKSVGYAVLVKQARRLFCTPESCAIGYRGKFTDEVLDIWSSATMWARIEQRELDILREYADANSGMVTTRDVETLLVQVTPCVAG